MLNKIFDAIFNGEVYDGLVPTFKEERKQKIDKIYNNYEYKIIEYQDNSYGLTIYECPIEKLECPECHEHSFENYNFCEKRTYSLNICKKCKLRIELIPNKVIYQKHQDYLLEEQRKEKLATQPKYPTCTSTNVKPISTVKRTGGLFMAGLASSTFGKTYECLHCKYKW